MLELCTPFRNGSCDPDDISRDDRHQWYTLTKFTHHTQKTDQAKMRRTQNKTKLDRAHKKI